jgi:hypothetical protein
VLDRDPEIDCQKNKNAGWDKDMAQQLNVKSDPSCGDAASVCVGTYTRLKKAVADYKSAMNEACQFANSPPACLADAGGQAAAPACAKTFGDQAKTLNAKAKQALQTAYDESKSYRDLSQAVSAHYTADLKKIGLLEKDSGAGDPTKSSTISGGKFSDSTEGGLFSQLKADVTARGGGATNMAEYKARGSDLVREQARATQTIDDFRKQAGAELKVRSELSTNLNTSTITDDKNAKSQTTAGSDVTGTKKDSDSSGNLLDKATSMTKLASAGTGLASAMGAASGMSGSSSPSAAALSGLNSTGGSSTSPTPDSTNAVASGFGDARAALIGAPGTAVDNTTKAPSRDVRIDHVSNLDGSSGSTGGRVAALDPLSPTGVGSTGSGTYMSAHGSTTGASSDAGISESGREPASAKKCSGNDCAAMGELKTEQFNAGGALGMPKIGAADPALSTKGALDNLFGPLPSLDSLMPKDPLAGAAGAAPAFESMLMNMDSPVPGVSHTEAQASAAAVAPANTRSLFDRVHSVHEVALKRGTVALYHKKL